MEEVFNRIKGEKKNTVENLVKWMQDSQLIGKDKKSEDDAKMLFSNVKDVTNVELEKFKEAVGKLATEQQKSVEEFGNMLGAASSKYLEAMGAAAQAAAAAAAQVMSKK